MFVVNLKETIQLGRKLAQGLNPQSIILLQGPIGAGKTSFVQGIADGLCIEEDITSPTFALSHHYNSGTIPLVHMDLYRLENISSTPSRFPRLIQTLINSWGVCDCSAKSLIEYSNSSVISISLSSLPLIIFSPLSWDLIY